MFIFVRRATPVARERDPTGCRRGPRELVASACVRFLRASGRSESDSATPGASVFRRAQEESFLRGESILFPRPA